MEEESFELANKVSADLMAKGYIVFSPISHSHPIAKSQELPGSWDFWEKFDRSFIEWCDEVWVIQHPMTEQSRGVKAEKKIAAELGKTIRPYYISKN